MTSAAFLAITFRYLIENIVQKFQLNRIALVVAFAAFQVRFPLR